MNCFTYTRGAWSDGMALPQIGENEQHTEYLERVGFSPMPNRLGVEFGSEIQLFEAERGSSYFAVVQPMANATYDVHIPDFPSLMLFLKDFAAAFGTLDVQSQLQDLNDGMRKLFHAYHGHSLDQMCKQCDPDRYQKAQDAQTRFANSGRPGPRAVVFE